MNWIQENLTVLWVGGIGLIGVVGVWFFYHWWTKETKQEQENARSSTRDFGLTPPRA